MACFCTFTVYVLDPDSYLSMQIRVCLLKITIRIRIRITAKYRKVTYRFTHVFLRLLANGSSWLTQRSSSESR